LAFSTSVSKLLWATWHQEFGELATELAGDESLFVGPGYGLNVFQDALIGSRAETIYGGSHEIQKNIIGERVLGLPR
jgi:alkylation response protein AidB-like acyl-CoA dehydrogenase